jgi:hypothetical protein
VLVLHDDRIINQYFTQNKEAKYLYCTNQLELFSLTQYYIVYHFETMEETISEDHKQNTHIYVEEGEESSSSSSSSCDTEGHSVNKKMQIK